MSTAISVTHCKPYFCHVFRWRSLLIFPRFHSYYILQTPWLFFVLSFHLSKSSFSSILQCNYHINSCLIPKHNKKINVHIASMLPSLQLIHRPILFNYNCLIHSPPHEYECILHSMILSSDGDRWRTWLLTMLMRDQVRVVKSSGFDGKWLSYGNFKHVELINISYFSFAGSEEVRAVLLWFASKRKSEDVSEDDQ